MPQMIICLIFLLWAILRTSRLVHLQMTMVNGRQQDRRLLPEHALTRGAHLLLPLLRQPHLSCHQSWTILHAPLKEDKRVCADGSQLFIPGLVPGAGYESCSTAATAFTMFPAGSLACTKIQVSGFAHCGCPTLPTKNPSSTSVHKWALRFKCFFGGPWFFQPTYLLWAGTIIWYCFYVTATAFCNM